MYNKKISYSSSKKAYFGTKSFSSSVVLHLNSQIYVLKFEFP